jgi:DNA-binding YbaB/EbfC family protein
MKNLGSMLKQAQEMQTKMAEMQERLSEVEIVGQAAAGMVRVIMTGKGDFKSVKIDPTLVDPAEVEVLEDLIAAAANDGRAKVEAYAQEEMGKLTGGLALPPGFKLPF